MKGTLVRFCLSSLLLASAALAQPARVSLAVSVNGAAERIAAGSPLIVAVTASGPGAGELARQIDVRLLDEQGEQSESRPVFRTVRLSGLPGTSTATALLTVAPEVTADLRPGRWAVQASVGEHSSAPGNFELALDVPVDRLLLSRWEQMEGNIERALELARAVMNETPDAVPAMLRVAELLEAREDFAGALHMVQSAIAASDDGDALVLHMRRKQLLRRLLGDEETPEPPARSL